MYSLDIIQRSFLSYFQCSSWQTANFIEDTYIYIRKREILIPFNFFHTSPICCQNGTSIVHKCYKKKHPFPRTGSFQKYLTKLIPFTDKNTIISTSIKSTLLRNCRPTTYTTITSNCFSYDHGTSSLSSRGICVSLKSAAVSSSEISSRCAGCNA